MTEREQIYADVLDMEQRFDALENGLDDRPVAGFADASDQPEVQTAIRERDKRDHAPRSRRVVIDACHYRSIQNYLRAILAVPHDHPERDSKVAFAGIALASYLSSSFDLDMFGKDLPPLETLRCIECGKASRHRLCDACYTEDKA